MRMHRTLLALCLLATPSLAETPLTAEAFDALTQGRTMTWAEFGQVYGVEQYLPDRRVRWTLLGDDCETGHWYPEGTAICFLYDGRTEPACWEITEGATGLIARHVSGAESSGLVVIEETTEPMACFRPEVGV